jgi:hypothetical protein
MNGGLRFGIATSQNIEDRGLLVVVYIYTSTVPEYLHCSIMSARSGCHGSPSVAD